MVIRTLLIMSGPVTFVAMQGWTKPAIDLYKLHISVRWMNDMIGTLYLVHLSHD